MGKTVRKTCILKIAEVTPALGVDFAEAIQNAYAALDRADDRRLLLQDEPRRYRLLNDFFPPFGTVMSARGSLFAFTENQNLNGVVLEPGAGSYPITAFGPPQEGSGRTEFVDGLTWFAAYRNYIAFFTERSVFPSTLEAYFGWLLSEAAKRRGGGDANVLVLLRDPPRPDLAGFDMTGVSSLVFKEPVRSEVETRRRRGGSGSSFVLKPKGTSFEVLKTLMRGLGATPPSFPGTQSPGQLENLRVEVRFSCLYPNQGGAAMSAMKNAAERIRDAGACGISFRFADGRTLDAEELAISTHMSISATDGLPNTSEAVRKLDEWLMRQVELIELAGEV